MRPAPRAGALMLLYHQTCMHIFVSTVTDADYPVEAFLLRVCAPLDKLVLERVALRFVVF